MVRRCGKFQYGDIVEYVAVDGKYERLNGSMGLVVSGPAKLIKQKRDGYFYVVAWVVRINAAPNELQGTGCRQDRLKLVKRGGLDGND